MVARTAAKVARSVLRQWSTPNPKRMREVIPSLAQAHWTKLGLDPATVQAQLQFAADRAAGGAVEAKINEFIESLLPKGWLKSLPEPERVSVALDRLTRLIGTPGGTGRRLNAAVENAVAVAATEIAGGGGLDVHAAVPALVDDPQFRLAGAEDMLRQFQTTTDRLIESQLATMEEQDKKARLAFEVLSQYAHYQKGTRKPTAAEFSEALRRFPRAQLQR